MFIGMRLLIYIVCYLIALIFGIVALSVLRYSTLLALIFGTTMAVMAALGIILQPED